MPASGAHRCSSRPDRLPGEVDQTGLREVGQAWTKEDLLL